MGSQMRVAIFSEAGTFEAMYKAERWCRERCFTLGPTSVGSPRGLLVGETRAIAKWHNLSANQRTGLDGVVRGPARTGPVEVWVDAGVPVMTVRERMESARRLCTDGSAERLMVAALRAGGLEMGFQALAEAVWPMEANRELWPRADPGSREFRWAPLMRRAIKRLHDGGVVQRRKQAVSRTVVLCVGGEAMDSGREPVVGEGCMVHTRGKKACGAGAPAGQ